MLLITEIKLKIVLFLIDNCYTYNVKYIIYIVIKCFVEIYGGVYMRLLLDFKIENENFQRDYRRIILSFIKKAMSEEFDGKLYNKYFRGKHYKDYGFAVLFDRPIFQNKQIIISGKKFKVLLSADDRDRTGLYIYGAVLAQKGKKFPLPMDNAMVLEKVTPINSTEIKSNKILCRFAAGGGLVLREHNKESNKDTYYTYNSPGFNNMFSEIVSNQLKIAGFDDAAAESISFTAVDCKKAVVEHYSTFIDSTLGVFILDGNKNALQYLYNAGMGSRNGFGFGLFDVIEQA